MRGRKLGQNVIFKHIIPMNDIKKESPNEGTETPPWYGTFNNSPLTYKKRIPEWGDGNKGGSVNQPLSLIKKESPNEGTETSASSLKYIAADAKRHKKRIPEWGDGNPSSSPTGPTARTAYKKRIPEWGDGNEEIFIFHLPLSLIKKESPNEGTETFFMSCDGRFATPPHKKRIPEWGDGNNV